jgi:two-component sensor histidine kinase
MKFKLLSLFLVVKFCFLAQPQIETLKTKLQNYQRENEIIRLYNQETKSTFKSDAEKASKYVDFALLLKQKKEVSKALEYLKEAERIYQERNLKDSLVYIKTAIAELMLNTDNKSKAFKYINQASGYIESSSIHKNILAFYYNRRAAIENAWGNKKFALELSLKVLALENEIQDKEILVYSCIEIASLKEFEFAKNEPVVFLRAYENALNMARKYKLKIPEIDVLLEIGAAYNRLENYDKEIEYYEQGLIIAYKVNSEYHKFLLHFDIVTPYKYNGNYKKAYENLRISINILNAIYYKTQNLEISEIEKKHKVEKKKYAFKLKKLEAESDKYYYWSIAAFAMLAYTAIVIMIFFFQKLIKTNREFKKLAKENEFLLIETNHRINNNLQLIMILISDELKKIPEKERSEFRILSKVESIATLHKHLYKKSDKQKIELSEYLKEIKLNFQKIFEENDISVEFEVHKKMLSTDEAIYLGLLLTELLINSIKHAFVKQKNKSIQFQCYSDDNFIDFSYTDNGNESKNKEIKPKLVQNLCLQMMVDFTIDSTNGFSFHFKKRY